MSISLVAEGPFAADLGEPEGNLVTRAALALAQKRNRWPRRSADAR